MSAVSRPGKAQKDVQLWVDHNHRRWLLEQTVSSEDDRAPFVCECPSGACVAVIELTMLEYERPPTRVRAGWPSHPDTTTMMHGVGSRTRILDRRGQSRVATQPADDLKTVCGVWSSFAAVRVLSR